jgi:hypothetical protein
VLFDRTSKPSLGIPTISGSVTKRMKTFLNVGCSQIVRGENKDQSKTNTIKDGGLLAYIIA